MSRKNIKIPFLARVEGEGALDLSIENDRIESLALRIFEPPRLFEKFLEERSYKDVLDVVSRICGICPIAYQMSAAYAIEEAFDIHPSSWVREMRRLYYCGEWVQSHSLHIHLLASPDFLGFNSALEMAAKYPNEVKRGMKLQALGNSLIKFLGARSVHPVGACVGGFYKAPTHAEAQEMLTELRNNVDDARELVHWTASLPIPQIHHRMTLVSLRHPKEYPFNEGRLISNKGLDISIHEFTEHFHEFHAPQSTALHCLLGGQSYLVGPLARLNLNYDLLPKEVLSLIDEIGLKLPTHNMFDSITARAIEIYYSILEAIRILEHYEYPDSPRIENIVPRAGHGYGCTEAPRGICWHHYEFNEEGYVKFAQIVPPTSQNQAHIEENLRVSLESYGFDHTDEELRLMSEMIIRNYDPCISCSTHFLKLKVNR